MVCNHRVWRVIPRPHLWGHSGIRKIHVYAPSILSNPRILFELKTPLPTEQSWNVFYNSFDAKSYEQICADFNVDKNTDWRQMLDGNGGLGLIFNYVRRTGYQPHKGFSYDAHQMTFTQYNVGKLHIDYNSQQHRNAWSTFILDKSNGLQDQASSELMIQSAHIAGQSSVLNLRSNRIALVSAAHLMCRSNFSPTLKTHFRARSICLARLSDIKTHSNTHVARLIMSSALDCT